MKKSFKEFLSQEPVILHCGATGTELIKRGGVTPGGISNITVPDLVAEIQRENVEAGAKIIVANSFSMNPLYCKSHVKNHDWHEINKRGMEIAVKVAGNNAYALGNIGPTGLLMDPMGTLSVKEARKAFQDQAQILLDHGAKGFSLQTFYDIRELKAAVEGVRKICDLPIVASVVLQENGATMMGDTLEKTWDLLKPLGINALGHNCGEIDAYTLGKIMEPLIKKVNIPLFACPNAGKPKLQNGQTFYDMTPEEFAEGILSLKEKGIRILGGCCGVSAKHIEAAGKRIL